jgi:ATP-dependent DNA helicase RecG
MPDLDMSRLDLDAAKLKHRPTLMSNYLQPALDAGLVEMTQPHSPNSPTQKYLLVSTQAYK